MRLYLDQTLEPGDHYINRYKRTTLPCDRLLDKPDELAQLSGPVKRYNIRDSVKEVKADAEERANGVALAEI